MRGTTLLLGEDFHHITAMQHCLDGSELAVDTCIMGMLPDMTVNLKSEIERRGLLWKIDGLPLGSENHNIIIIKRSDYILILALLHHIQIRTNSCGTTWGRRLVPLP